MKTDKELQIRLEDMGLSPWDIEKWLKCPHVEWKDAYTMDVQASLEAEKPNIRKTQMCKECNVPKNVWDEAND